jgi:hypothetical protein
MQEVHMTKDLFSLGDVARLLRTQPHRIQYLLTTGQVPEPRIRIGSRRIWTMAEILPISDKIGFEKISALRASEGGPNE